MTGDISPYTPDTLPLDNIVWGKLVRLIANANSELGRYDGVLKAVPNPMLLLSPMTTQEAVLSSRIEGTQANLRDVLEYQAAPKHQGRMSEGIRHDIQEIINYRLAMEEAVEELTRRPLSLNMIRSIHWTLMDSVRGQNKARGEFRRIQNFIGAPDSTIETARYVPPDPLRLMEYLDNFEKYIHYDEEDRLVQLAIIHAQFEIIHPFLDGNGRVGRILIPLFLYEKELLTTPTFYMSEYLEANDAEYRDRLLAITKTGAWMSWIQFFLEAVAGQARANTAKAESILQLYDAMKAWVTESTHSQYAIQILDGMFSMPYFTINQFADRTNIPRATASRALNKLVEDGALNVLAESSGQRPAIIEFSRLVDVVEG